MSLVGKSPDRVNNEIRDLIKKADNLIDQLKLLVIEMDSKAIIATETNCEDTKPATQGEN